MSLQINSEKAQFNPTILPDTHREGQNGLPGYTWRKIRHARCGSPEYVRFFDAKPADENYPRGRDAMLSFSVVVNDDDLMEEHWQGVSVFGQDALDLHPYLVEQAATPVMNLQGVVKQNGQYENLMAKKLVLFTQSLGQGQPTAEMQASYEANLLEQASEPAQEYDGSSNSEVALMSDAPF